MKKSLKKFVDRIKSSFQIIVYSFISRGLPLVLLSFVVLLFAPLLNRDYQLILSVSEFAIIGSGTLAILTFTYAIAIGKDRRKYFDIILSGEQFLKSTLTFIIGIGFFSAVGLIFKNVPFVSKNLGMLSPYYYDLGVVGGAIILLIGESSLIASAYFLSKGIVKLSEVLKLIEE